MQFLADGNAATWEAPAQTCGAIALARFREDNRLVQAWQSLEDSAFLPTQIFAFSLALGCTLLSDACIEVFHVTGAATITALLPLCRDKTFFSRWRLIGAREVFEPGDALCESPESMRALAQTLARQSRPLDLDRVPASSPLLPALKTAMKGKGWVSIRPAVPFPTVTLDECWKNPESCFNSGRRSDFRRAARRAAEFGVVSCEVLSPRPEEFDALFYEAIGVELCSWKREAGTAIAVDRGKEAFFRDFFRTCCERGQFRIAFMRIDGQAVAMQMAVEFSDRYWLFRIGYDETFGKCSPGTLLMLHTLGWAAQQGLRAYELLGDAEAWIADFWTREQHGCVRLRTYPFGLRGAVAFAVDAGVWLRQRLVRGQVRAVA